MSSARRPYIKATSLKDSLMQRIILDETSDCWNWAGCIGNHGYGVFAYGGVQYLSHRAAFKVFKGEIPDDKLIQHSCDNKRCCNPAHISAGTDQTNCDDKVNKKRHSFGEKAPNHKLSNSDIAKIISDDRHQHEIAADLGVHQSLISRIKNRHRWKDAA